MTKPERDKLHGWRLWGVWSLRLIVGAVFIYSGLAKLIDLWGTVFKIEDYAAVWDLDVPRTVIMMSALMLSTFEFSAGLLLLLGAYRRVVSWALAACMLFMLPLTAYIWIASPVNDCGCFGELLVISNAATFWKNVVLTAMIVFLVVYNHRVDTVIKAPIQWFVTVVILFYCMTVALVGYNIQPMIDFRPYRIGASLIHVDDNDNSRDICFIYSRDGVEREFDINELPDEEEGWEFVRREDPAGKEETDNRLEVFDPVTGEDVTEEYLADADSMLLLVITEPARADLSYTYMINELNEALGGQGARVVGLLATGEKGIERWLDYSMASYPCLRAEDTQLKELARGVMSMVWVRNDTIVWKRTVSSITNDDVEAIVAGHVSMSDMTLDLKRLFWKLTAALGLIILLVYLLQTAILQFVKKSRTASVTGK